jgi:hypothetical protein
MRWLLFFLLELQLDSATLQPETLEHFRRYMDRAASEMEQRGLAQNTPRLGLPLQPAISPWTAGNPLEVPHGLIHDWLGAVFVPDARIEDALAVLRNVSRYPEIYSGEILEARLLSSGPGRRRVLLRVVKKKVITVVLEIEFDVEERFPAPGRAQVWSRSSRVAEVQNAGKPQETIKPPDTGWGFLWRLNSYWHFEERNGGLLMECRAVSLTRDIPAGLGWILQPMVTSLPREALASTLVKTKAAVETQAAARRAAGRLHPAVLPRAALAGLSHAAPRRP